LEEECSQADRREAGYSVITAERRYITNLSINRPLKKNEPPRCLLANNAAAFCSDFPPIATGCVAARRAKVGHASAIAVKKTLAHAVLIGTSVGMLGEKFDSF